MSSHFTKVVVALGGNALQEAGSPPTAEAQLAVVRKTCDYLADISCKDMRWQLSMETVHR